MLSVQQKFIMFNSKKGDFWEPMVKAVGYKVKSAWKSIS